MKKVFLLLMVITVLMSSLWISVGTASAASLAVTVYAPGATQADVDNATVFVGSEYHQAFCVLKDAETGKVVCKVSEKFASEGAVLYVAGQAFYLTLPEVHENQPAEEPLTCTAPEVPGADVAFTNFKDYTSTYFIAGDTLADVADNADRWLGSYWVSYEIVGGLHCEVYDT